MIFRILDTVWGQTTSYLVGPFRWRRWIDVMVLAAVAGIVLAALLVTRQWTAIQRPIVEINLAPSALPKYLLLSLVRAATAFVISLGFSLLVAYWAAKDAIAERILVPILDILQSIPLLSFMPLVVLVMWSLFPHSNVGLELSAVILIVTCQAWNMAFSFYQSLKTLPKDLDDIATVNHFNWWQRLRYIELPFATPGLVWNSMVSVANSWFFLVGAEAFKSAQTNFQLPGIGSYMSVATDVGNGRAQLFAILTMLVLVVLLDRFVWKPLVVWSQRFQVDESIEVERPESWLLLLLRRSRLVRWIEHWRFKRRQMKKRHPRLLIPLVEQTKLELQNPGARGRWFARVMLILVVLGLALGGISIFRLLAQVERSHWMLLLKGGAASTGRVLFSTLLATLWTLPVGLWIGLSVKWSKRLQSVVQVAASFPWSMVFAAVIIALRKIGIDLGVSCVVLMMVSTQWYLLFNIIAGAQSVPKDLREVMRAYRVPLWRRCWTLYFPAIFPFIVTGWVTATGGAWNASILTEWIDFKPEALSTTYGLGAEVVRAAGQNTAHLAAASLLMVAIVVAFNRLVWDPLYRLAETKYKLGG